MRSVEERRRQVLAIIAALTMVGLSLVWTGARDREEAPLPGEPVDAPWSLVPHTGLGAWIDVYDWTLELTNGRPSVVLDDIDQMAAAGIETVYVQTAHNRSAEPGVIERPRLEALIDRAHEQGMWVVAWYLPPLVDLDTDLARLVASAELEVDGLAVDIEAREVDDVAERNRRLLELTARLRTAVGDDQVLGAITPSPTHLQVVNTSFWPDFPWVELGQAYDVILPMSYWSFRRGELRDGERYVGGDIDRVRFSMRDPDIPIHAIGGVADGLVSPDLAGMARAIEARGVLGGSLYDWATSHPSQWDALAPLRSQP